VLIRLKKYDLGFFDGTESQKLIDISVPTVTVSVKVKES